MRKARLRILLWHGYLLAGTGSNVYTRSVAKAWSEQGHQVTVFCQEPSPEHFDLGGADLVRPDIHGQLPVFVLDRYEGLTARLLPDFSVAERERYIQYNAAALRDHLPADLVFANHVLMGGPVGAATGTRFAVKVHGSELEYAIRGRPELAALSRESLTRAAAIYAGSTHVRRALTDICGPLSRVHVVPPGVDVDRWRPRPRAEALAGLLAEARRDQPGTSGPRERLPDDGYAERLAAFLADDEPTVLYFGKLTRNKGVHLLLEALRGLSVRALMVGFGEDRAELEAQAPARTLFVGPLEHRHLVHLLPLADVSAVPSIFPEAFGMAAAEAASSGTPPLLAHQSGLAEVAEALSAAYPPEFAHLASFRSGDAADLRVKLKELLDLAPRDRRRLGAAARQLAVRRWSWSNVAEQLLHHL